MSAFGGKADMNGSGFAVIQDREELEPAKRQRNRYKFADSRNGIKAY
jgi:hypothetical protein